MIGKPQWFKVRKYGGWGLTPATKQGWAYIGAFILIVLAVQNLPLSQAIKTAITTILGVLLCLDVLDIMFHLKKDEREVIHEAISERNASWAMIATMVVIFAYKSISTALNGGNNIDTIMLIPLFIGVVAKGLTYFYLKNK
ncbi:MAG TPA: hypothetical protein VLH94_01470 [Spirochaetia bacterium]|nr:hypothetical protein [Spirochaetia bacterium]